ncbi:hypothetical protein [Methanolacinia paynteri]|uniref:hypothetical protein n=1 Tax=Methanolacinia paynteri TaxID=230356 RepID=UPI00064E5E94|nr:hypothetical protein [Methanolacinia paynteri]
MTKKETDKRNKRRIDKRNNRKEESRRAEVLLDADSVIPVRTWQGGIRSRTHLQKMYTDFNPLQCWERNKVETAFSVLKGRFREELKTRKYSFQVKEIKSTAILHDLTKAGQAVIIVSSGRNSTERAEPSAHR